MYGKKLKSIIKTHGFSQKDIAKKINVPESSFSSWINMDTPPVDIIENVCQLFDIELWEFFMSEDAYKKLFNMPKEYILITKKLSDIKNDKVRIQTLKIIDEIGRASC